MRWIYRESWRWDSWEESTCQGWGHNKITRVQRQATPGTSHKRRRAARRVNHHLPSTLTHPRNGGISLQRSMVNVGAWDRQGSSRGLGLQEAMWWHQRSSHAHWNLGGERVTATAHTLPLQQAESWTSNLDYKDKLQMKKHQIANKSFQRERRQ